MLTSTSVAAESTSGIGIPKPAPALASPKPTCGRGVVPEEATAAGGCRWCAEGRLAGAEWRGGVLIIPAEATEAARRGCVSAEERGGGRRVVRTEASAGAGAAEAAEAGLLRLLLVVVAAAAEAERHRCERVVFARSRCCRSEELNAPRCQV